MTPNELRAERIALKPSQEALARQLGLSANAVARWEQGKRAAPPMLRLAMEYLKIQNFRFALAQNSYPSRGD